MAVRWLCITKSQPLQGVVKQERTRPFIPWLKPRGFLARDSMSRAMPGQRASGWAGGDPGPLPHHSPGSYSVSSLTSAEPGLSAAKDFDNTSVVRRGLNGAGELGREALAEAVADEVADRREGACGDIQGCGQVLGVRACYTRMTPVESTSAIPRDARSVSDTLA